MAVSNQLRGKLPSKVEKRLKVMFYGVAGCGKTTCALQFPKPYYIDTERGAEHAQYVEALEKSGGVLFQSNSFEEIRHEVKILSTLKHQYKTLVIDSITVLYEDIVEQEAAKIATGKNGYNRDYVAANKRMKAFINLCLTLDMNVIFIARSKDKYEGNGDSLKVIGQTFSTYKDSNYTFDLVLHVKNGGFSTENVSKITATVEKSRLISFPEGHAFNFDYANIAERYGRSVLEKDAVPVSLVNKETLELLESLILEKGMSEKWINNCKSSKGVSNISEFTQEDAVTLITFLRAKDSSNVISMQGDK